MINKTLTLEERTAIVDAQCLELNKHGFRIISRRDKMLAVDVYPEDLVAASKFYTKEFEEAGGAICCRA